MIGERIELIRGKQARESFAAELGVHPQTLARYEKGERLPDSAFLETLSKRYNVDPAWLLTGEGKLDGKTAADFRERKIPQMEKARRGTAVDATPSRVGEPLEPVVKGTTPEYIECMDCRLAMIPMVEARLSAGSGSFEVGETSDKRYAFHMDFLTRKGRPSSMVLMRVDGDSMEPHIFNNDAVLIDQSQTKPRAGGLYAVGVEEVVYIKMVDTLPGKIVLKSYNQAYPPLEVDAREDLADGIRIIGRAVWIGRELY